MLWQVFVPNKTVCDAYGSRRKSNASQLIVIPICSTSSPSSYHTICAHYTPTAMSTADQNKMRIYMLKTTDTRRNTERETHECGAENQQVAIKIISLNPLNETLGGFF